MECSEKVGRGERIRTSDPHTPSVMRYQAALRPDQTGAIRRKRPAWQEAPSGFPLLEPLAGVEDGFAFDPDHPAPALS